MSPQGETFDVFGAVHVPHRAQCAPAKAALLETLHGPGEYFIPAPLDALENGARYTPASDKRVAAVLGGREHRIVTRAQQA